MADAFKAAGNKAFAAKDFTEAVEQFSKAIEAEPSNHVLYSNRSGAYASLKDYTHALEDAEKTTELKPDWSKGWSRKGGALHGQGDLVEAMDAFEEALKLDASNAQAKSGKDSVQRAIDAEAKGAGGDPMGGLGNMFNDPQMIPKLAKNPKTSGLLADPSFMNKLQNLRNNPSSMGQELGDPRMLQVMSVLLGIDMSMGDPGSMGDKAAGGKVEEEEGEDVPMPDARPSSRPPPKRELTPEPEPEDEEAAAKKKAKAEADEEKRLGTEQYKKRQFDSAITHYDKAWSLHHDITYLTNKSAAQFEKADYESAIATCKEAITEGREMLADFKIIAKAFGRIGSAYEKLGDLPNAIDNYQRSLTEHRTPDTLNKLRAAEKAKLTAEKDAYINPSEAEKARELGNAKFKDADWPAAVDAYSEMTKRAPTDPRGYSNRAACLIKLLTFPAAVSDCDAALALDPTFIRAYLRKAQAYFAMREYSRCMDVCAEASTQDKDGKNAREISQQEQKALQAQFQSQEGESEEETMKRIQRDPEIVGMLQDPVMQSILQQAKSDPKALQDHMKDPRVA
ncbi:MAG: Hsp90 cochaperone [Chrysothrix sp. TS-e1954]|nr:MAG: Hsp90 cochaperone [Chrysothrix sp. TS-e1954]